MLILICNTMAKEEKKEKQGSTSEKKSVAGKVLGVGVPLVLVVLLILFASGGTALAIWQYPQLLGLYKEQTQIDAETALVMQVGRLIQLPEGEKPSVVFVTDAQAVKDQPFFRNAQTGDRVLIYSGSQRAILFRPSENRIIEVGVLNINQDTGKEIDLEEDNVSEEVLEEESPSPEPTEEPSDEPEEVEAATEEEE